MKIQESAKPGDRSSSLSSVTVYVDVEQFGIQAIA